MTLVERYKMLMRLKEIPQFEELAEKEIQRMKDNLSFCVLNFTGAFER